MDAMTALETMPELYRQARSAAERLAALIASAAPAADIVFAAASANELRAALDRQAEEVLSVVPGVVRAARRQGIREGRRLAAAEQARSAAAARPLRLAASS